MSPRAPRLPLYAALILAALVMASGGCTGMRPTLGEPRPTGFTIYQPPPGGHFDYFVYVSNADRRMEDRAKRLAEVRRLMVDRCPGVQAVDLYAHDMGPWSDGSPHVTYVVGVLCPQPGGPAS